jgi:hypothetical protein
MTWSPRCYPLPASTRRYSRLRKEGTMFVPKLRVLSQTTLIAALIAFFTLSTLVLTLTSCNQAPVSQSQPAAATAATPQNSAPKPADIQGTPAGTVMTPEYVASVGRIAYLWGWPLVNNLNRSLGVKDLPGPGLIGDVVPAAPPCSRTTSATKSSS